MTNGAVKTKWYKRIEIIVGIATFCVTVGTTAGIVLFWAGGINEKVSNISDEVASIKKRFGSINSNEKAILATKDRVNQLKDRVVWLENNIEGFKPGPPIRDVLARIEALEAQLSTTYATMRKIELQLESVKRTYEAAPPQIHLPTPETPEG